VTPWLLYLCCSDFAGFQYQTPKIRTVQVMVPADSSSSSSSSYQPASCLA
jgi:hypothetical protein